MKNGLAVLVLFENVLPKLALILRLLRRGDLLRRSYKSL